MTSSIVLAIVAIAVVAVAVYYMSSSSTSSGDGRIVVAMTDAAADMGSVTQVLVTVDQVRAHSTADSWVTVSSSSQTYDLLQLKANGELALVADANVTNGTYDQFRLRISKVIVVDSNGSHEAKLPSSELKVYTNLTVNADSTTTATFDFIADESLHVTGNGLYILAPVIQFEGREDADVDIDSDDKVEINGGSVKSQARVGMDINGNVGEGLEISDDLDLDIDASGLIKAKNKTSGLNVGITY